MNNEGLPVVNDGKSWVSFFDTPNFVGANLIEKLETLPWEDVYSQGGVLTRRSLWLTPKECICPYAYGRKKQVYQPVNIPSFLETMTRDLETFLGLEPETLNSLNANKYSEPEHDIQWHSDNEKLFRASEFDRNTLIVSVSFGATRTFSIRRKYGNDDEDIPIKLKHGDILIMGGLLQDNYLHAVKPLTSVQRAKAGASSATRYNLTWRVLRQHTRECLTN